MRLIDADVLEIVVLGACWYDNRDEEIAYDLVKSFPEVDAELVVRGKWIAEQNDAEYCEFRCSECDHSVGKTDQFDETEVKQFSEWYKYCPNCGVKMEVEQ